MIYYLRSLFFFVSFFCLYQPSLACVTWEGDVSSDWNLPANWQGDQLPTSTNPGHIVIIDPAYYVNPPVISANSAFTPVSLLVQNNGQLTIDGDIEVLGATRVMKGSSVSVLSGTWTIATGNQLSIEDNGSEVIVDGGAIVSQGDIVINGNTNGSGANPSLNILSGSVSVAKDLIFSENPSDRPELNISDGTLSVSGNIVDSNTNANINISGGTVNLAGDFDLEGLIDEISMNGGTINIAGNLNFDGTATLTGGAFVLDGPGSQSISTGSEISFYNLTISNSGTGVTLLDTVGIQGTLTVSAGTLQTNGRLKILSNASGDGSIGPSNGTISGNVVVQRYIDAGATHWRFMSSPVQNATFEDWKDDFLITGFPGSHYPNFSFISIYGYDETDTGDKETGFTPPSNITNAIIPGKGYFVFSGDSAGGSSEFTVEVDGPVNSGPMNLGVTFTNSGGIAHDGWCLVGNPYPSAIDWDSPAWTKSNINDALYVFNTDLGQYAAYVGGAGVNGGSNLISSGQAFFVQANSGSPSLIVNEGAKSSNPTGFLRDENPHPLVMRLTVGYNNREAESLLRFSNSATHAFDRDLDAVNFRSVDGIVELATISEGLEMAINSLPVPLEEKLTVPVVCKTGGAFKIHYSIENSSGIPYCIQLYDAVDNVGYDLDASGTLEFNKAVSMENQRFQLIFGNNSFEDVGCDLTTGLESQEDFVNFAMYNEGEITISDHHLVQQRARYYVLSSSGQIAKSGLLNSKTVELSELNAGFYVFWVVPGIGHQILKFVHTK